MNGRQHAAEPLIDELMSRLPELALPPATDWDLLEVLLEACSEESGDPAYRRSMWATLYSARNALSLADNRILASSITELIDRRLAELGTH